MTIANVLEAAVATGQIPGAVAGVTGPDGTLTQAAAGVTLLGGDQPMGPDTLFWIASMTKPVTSLAAMQLVERGKLALDAPIGALLPDLAQPMILQDGQLHPAKGHITLRHLLTHTAGFSYSFASKEYLDYITANNIPTAPGIRASLNMPLLFEPGARWCYGINTDWVGLAVEAASGQKLDAYFAEHIFAPLGMGDTTFWPTADQWARRATPHQRQADGSLTPVPPSTPRVPEFYSGGGGLFSTLTDYLKFLRVFLNDGAGLISPASLQEMTRNQIGALRAGVIPSANPAVMRDSDMNPGQDSKWGLGFLIFPQKGMFGRNAGSLAWAGLPNTYFWIDPAVNRAAVILMQILPSGDPAAVQTLCAFESAVYAAPR